MTEECAVPASVTEPEADSPSNFIRDMILEDLKNDKHQGKVATRFPPEPNGYLHIGHAKSICLNFGMAREFKGTCNLRFDDTNPTKEDVEYVDSIMNDVRWLGFEWDNLCYASDYFQKFYDYALDLIRQGKAYVESLSADEIRECRGNFKLPGKESPYRNRPMEENVELFEKMKNGEMEDGSCVLRAKIDMASPNMAMRDPTIFRIRKTPHHRTGDEWCIYPMYDFAHCLSDATEGITHSLCTLEFEANRPLYDWFINQLNVPSKPEQTEFARLSLTYTVMSKRKLLQLVKEKLVNGWDDPRMPTIAGMRRRGYPPKAIREFCDRIGVSKANSTVEFALLEDCIRDSLNSAAQRVMAVLKPLKVVITNYPEGKVEQLEAENNPEDPSMGKRMVSFSREIFIEGDDFMESPPPKYFRLSPGKEIRLKHAYCITCQKAVKDPATGEIIELRCTYDPESRGGTTPDGRKIRGTSHWVSASNSVEATVRVYDHLFNRPDPENVEDGKTFLDNINPESLCELKGRRIEPAFAASPAGTRFQFLRQGYFCVDDDSSAEKPVFNRIVGLRDSWAKTLKKG